MSDQRTPKQKEQGVELPYQEIDPDTLRRMIQEFVSRDGSDWAAPGGSLGEKVDQVLRQLRSGQAKIVFDLHTNTADIVPCR